MTAPQEIDWFVSRVTTPSLKGNGFKRRKLRWVTSYSSSGIRSAYRVLPRRRLTAADTFAEFTTSRSRAVQRLQSQSTSQGLSATRCDYLVEHPISCFQSQRRSWSWLLTLHHYRGTQCPTRRRSPGRRSAFGWCSPEANSSGMATPKLFIASRFGVARADSVLTHGRSPWAR